MAPSEPVLSAPRPRAFKKAVQRTTRVLAHVAVAAAFAGALVGGVQFIHSRAAERPAPAAPAPMPVAVVTVSEVDGYEVEDRFVGRVEARRNIHVAFERAGLLVSIEVDEGDRVTQGTVLAALDASLLEAERDRLDAERQRLVAQQELARLTEDRQSRLNARGHASQQVLDEARLARAALDAAIAAVDASLSRVALDIEKSTIVAPFSGTIGARHADPGAVVEGGAPVLTLYESQALEARVGIAPDVSKSLTAGDSVTLRVGRTSFDATIAAVRPDLSPATRTVPVLIALPQNARAVLGDTVEVVLTRRVAGKGFWVPQDALTEGERGLWTVLTVVGAQSDHVVGVETVELIHLADGRALVRGTLHEGMQVIAAGRHRVVRGQSVTVSETGMPVARANALGGAFQ